MNSQNKLDITKNIKMIEILKGQILEGVSDLHNSFIQQDNSTSDKVEIFADLIILIYILARRIGVSPETLLVKINNKLKVGVLQDEDVFIDDIKELLKYFNMNNRY
ncbi:MAG: MazG-like family protein [bacterium]